MPLPSPLASATWVAGLPLTKAARDSGFRIELLLGQDPAQPFVALGDSGRFSRVLLARLAGPGGATVKLLALKVQRDAYRSIGAGGVVDNREVEAMWQREHDYLRRLGDRGAVPLVATGPEGVLPPMCLDRATGRLFPVVSPVSWGPLATCRDDALLRDAGLEPWSTTTSRFLCCSKVQGTFYTWSAQDGAQPKAGVRVRRRHDLYRDLVVAFAQLTEPQQKLLREQMPDLAAALADLTVETVEQRLVPLSFYEAWAIVTELQQLHFDEFCDLAGGASLAQACLASVGRAAALVPLQARLSGDQQWLSAPWTAGDDIGQLVGDPPRIQRLALEATWLKLHAWVQVCRATAGFHVATGVPHLGLSSDNIMLSLPGRSGAMWPARWGFEAVLVDLGASHRRALSGLGTGDVGPLCLPGHDAVSAYVGPLLDPAAMQRELTMQGVGKRLLEGDQVVGLSLTLRSARERLDSIHPGDVVRLQADVPLPGIGEQPLLGKVTGLLKDGATVEVRLDAARSAALPEATLTFVAATTFHRRLQTPCDLFALGMLLSRALLVHDERDLFAVREVWDQLLDKLDMMLSGAKDVDAERVAATARSLLDNARTSLGSGSVVWPSALRCEIQEPVPARLWRELLLLIFRLTTTRRGFSFAAHHGDVKDGEVDLPLRRVLQEAEELLAALQIELCDAAPRAGEIAAITNDVTREVSAAMAGKEAAQ